MRSTRVSTAKSGSFSRPCHSRRVYASRSLSDDGLVTPGQTIKVSSIVANREAARVNLSGVTLSGFESTSACTGGQSNAAA